MTEGLSLVICALNPEDAGQCVRRKHCDPGILYQMVFIYKGDRKIFNIRNKFLTNPS